MQTASFNHAGVCGELKQKGQHHCQRKLVSKWLITTIRLPICVSPFREHLSSQHLATSHPLMGLSVQAHSDGKDLASSRQMGRRQGSTAHRCGTGAARADPGALTQWHDVGFLTALQAKGCSAKAQPLCCLCSAANRSKNAPVISL